MLDPVNGDKKIKNLVIGVIKRVWHRHPTRLSILNRVRQEEPLIKKDGSIGKRPQVFYICELCGAKAKAQPSKYYPQMHIDHIDPVVPVHLNTELMTWDVFIDRLFCNEENLQAICTNCHDVKTKAETKQRKIHRDERKSK